MKSRHEMSAAEIADTIAANPSWCERREPKACAKCGHVRSVRVTFVVQYNVERDHHWQPHCRACQADARARWYEREARRFRERASELRAKQQARTVQRYSGKKRSS